MPRSRPTPTATSCSDEFAAIDVENVKAHLYDQAVQGLIDATQAVRAAARRPHHRTTDGRARWPDKVKVLVVGLGNMGASHASAYHRNPGFEIVGLMSRSIKSQEDLRTSSRAIRCSRIIDEALAATRPDAVSINTWPNTHAEYAIKAINAGAHVFMEKPLATNIADAEAVVTLAREKNKQAGARLYPARPSELGEVHRARARRSASRW